MAEAGTCSATLVALIESGERLPSEERLERLCEAIGLDPARARQAFFEDRVDRECAAFFRRIGVMCGTDEEWDIADDHAREWLQNGG